jgi:predicted GIY-YIG superfamily endonuclease
LGCSLFFNFLNTSMFYAYVIQSIDSPKQIYRGFTSNLKERLAVHNNGKCPHTSKYKPWQIKFYAAFETSELARKFESYLKSGSGHAFAKRHLFVTSG